MIVTTAGMTQSGSTLCFSKRLLKKIRFSLTDYQIGVIIDRTSYKAMSNCEVAKRNT